MNPLFQALSVPLQAPRFQDSSSKPNEFLSGSLTVLSNLFGDTIRSLVSETILPSLTLTKKEILRLESKAKKELASMKNVEVSRLTVDASCSLERVAFSSGNKPMAERKFIVYFLPNYELWQSRLAFFSELQQTLGVDVICTNYRGCGKSEGFPYNQRPLVNDGLVQVQQLIDQGAKAENIALYGYSLGGGVSLGVAASLEDKGISVNLINERSFRSLLAVIKTIEVIGVLGAAFADTQDWGLPSEEYLKKLKGRVLIIHNDNDDVIEFEPSLKAALNDNTYPNKDKIHCLAMQKTKAKSQHNRNWTASEKRAIFAAIKDLFKPSHDIVK